MNKKALLTVLFAVTLFGVSAQKLTQGSLAFLEGQEKLNVVFNFDDVKLQYKSETDYLKTATPKWAEEWETAKSSTFKEQFLDQLNKNVQKLQCGDYPNAQYQATIRVVTITREGAGASLEGPGTRIVIYEAVFTKTGDSEPLAKITNAKTNLQTQTVSKEAPAPRKAPAPRAPAPKSPKAPTPKAPKAPKAPKSPRASNTSTPKKVEQQPGSNTYLTGIVFGNMGQELGIFMTKTN